MPKTGDGTQPSKLRLRLYVSGEAPNSLRAIENTRSICARHFASHDIEVVDLMLQPARASADRIVVTPTLIKLAPEPQQRLIGDLSDAVKLLTALSGGGA